MKCCIFDQRPLCSAADGRGRPWCPQKPGICIFPPAWNVQQIKIARTLSAALAKRTVAVLLIETRRPCKKTGTKVARVCVFGIFNADFKELLLCTIRHQRQAPGSPAVHSNPMCTPARFLFCAFHACSYFAARWFLCSRLQGTRPRCDRLIIWRGERTDLLV